MSSCPLNHLSTRRISKTCWNWSLLASHLIEVPSQVPNKMHKAFGLVTQWFGLQKNDDFHRFINTSQQIQQLINQLFSKSISTSSISLLRIPAWMPSPLGGRGGGTSSGTPPYVDNGQFWKQDPHTFHDSLRWHKFHWSKFPYTKIQSYTHVIYKLVFSTAASQDLLLLHLLQLAVPSVCTETNAASNRRASNK